MSYAESGDRLNLLGRSLINARDNDEAREILSDVGYMPEVIEEGQALHDSAQALIRSQRTADKLHDDACTALRNLEEKLDHLYGLDRAVAQRVFKGNTTMLTHLGLKGERDDTVPGRFEHSRKLYDLDLNEADEAKMTRGGLSAQRRSERLQMAQQAQNLRAQVSAALSKQKGATEARDTAIEVALAWLTDFRRIARKAFKDKPHLLDLFEMKG